MFHLMKGASPFVKKQLVAFAIASVVGIVFLSMTFLRVPETLGVGRYHVDVQFARGAGLYEGAEVTYLGHPVGKVSSMTVHGDGLTAELSLDTDTEIPATVRADIHSRSAVGEQYVALSNADPDNATGTEILADGDTIPESRTSAPVEIGPVLDNIYALVESLDADQLNTVLTQISRGLEGRTGDLQTILDDGAQLLALADQNFGPTASLIRDTGPLLGTINGTSEHVRRLTRNLAQVTAELRAGDDDIRNLLADGPRFADTTNGLIDDLAGNLPPLLHNANTITRVLSTFDPHLQQILSDYPLAVAIVQSITLPAANDHAGRLTVANVNDPPECTQGFVPPSQWTSPFDDSPRRTPLVFCTAPHSDPRAVRGARNIPCPLDSARREGDVSRC